MGGAPSSDFNIYPDDMDHGEPRKFELLELSEDFQKETKIEEINNLLEMLQKKQIQGIMLGKAMTDKIRSTERLVSAVHGQLVLSEKGELCFESLSPTYRTSVERPGEQFRRMVSKTNGVLLGDEPVMAFHDEVTPVLSGHGISYVFYDEVEHGPFPLFKGINIIRPAPGITNSFIKIKVY